MFKVISGYILHKSPNFHADLDLLSGLLTITVAFSTVQCGEGGKVVYHPRCILPSSTVRTSFEIVCCLIQKCKSDTIYLSQCNSVLLLYVLMYVRISQSSS
jgi:hypothetical protein